MQDLKLHTTLPALSFDYAALKSWAIAMTEKYTGLVVTEDAVIDAKKDMAELNKAKKAVDDARKEAVRRVSEPIRAFETQIKEICGIFDTAYGTLGEQVKRFEDAQREAKRKDVEGLIIEANMHAFGEPTFLVITIQDKWLNKTSSLKSIREDISEIIEGRIEDEQRRKALEQARQDRVASIENHVEAMRLLLEVDLPLSRFLNSQALDMYTPLAEILLDIERQFRTAADARRAQASAKAAQHQDAAPSSPSVQAAPSAPKATGQTRTMYIVLEYDLVNETQVKACLENLKMLCINFGARHR